MFLGFVYLRLPDLKHVKLGERCRCLYTAPGLGWHCMDEECDLLVRGKKIGNRVLSACALETTSGSGDLEDQGCIDQRSTN